MAAVSPRPVCLQSASIVSMATLYVRDVPERVYTRLRAQARAAGRSVNAEALKILEESLRRRARGSVTAELQRIAREINLPSDAPRPEDLIRKGRDERTREIERRTRRS